MSTGYCDCKETLPLGALRWVRAFRPRMRRGLVRLLQERQKTQGSLSAQDMAECISLTWAMLEADAESRLEIPPPDMDMVERARAAARENRGTTIQKILDAIP